MRIDRLRLWIQRFQAPVYRPDRGAIALPTTPGLGFTLDESKIERRRDLEL